MRPRKANQELEKEREEKEQKKQEKERKQEEIITDLITHYRNRS